MTGTNSSQGGLTRRSFLKTTGAVAGAVTLAGAEVSLAGLAPTEAHAEETVEEQVVRSACRGNCGSKCHMKVTVREGKVVKVSAEDYPGEDAPWRRLCVKGYTQPQRVYDADRLKYPMRRVGERGAGEWERISWDDAIAEIVGKMQAAVAEAGPTSVGFWSSYASYGVLNGAQAGYMSIAYGRFITGLGATILGAGADNAQIHEQMLQLRNNGNAFTDAANANVIISWGGNPAEAYVHAWQFVCDAREKGAKFITIDPQFTASAMHSDWYLPIRPGTDGALMLAMANYIYENDLMDEGFLCNNSVAPFLVKEDGTYLRMSDFGAPTSEGPADQYTGMPTVIDPVVVWDEAAGTYKPLGEASSPAILGSYVAGDFAVKTTLQECLDRIGDYTVEKAAEICDLAPEDIEKLARVYATEGPVFVMTFQGFGHHVNSHHNYKNLALICAMTGNAGKPGAAVCGATSPAAFPTNSRAFMMGRPGANFCGMYLPQVMETKQWAGKPLDLRVLWCHNGNMLSCESGRLELIEAVKKVDFVVCADVNMTDTAQWADILLPVPHAFEVEDFDGGCPTPYPLYMHKAIEPLYECKTDLEIMRLVAEGMGLGKLYAKSDEDFLREVIDTDMNKAAGCTYDAFKSGKFVRTYLYPKGADVARYPSTETGRFKFYLEKPTPRNIFGQKVADYERYPYYEDAKEAYWDNPLREKYPLMGCSQHHKYHVHSQCAYTPLLRELEPEPELKINASDAAARGISQGDVVRAYNDHGYVVLKAMVTEGIKPGVVSIPHGFQADQFIEGHSQDLTSVYMNDFCSNSAFYDFLCEVEKA
ncbi:molybdopterin-dependent oxidoreductase [Adlercreutzia sp. ZJ473]|uniref:molybdopterin-dependent oxidoreductase n=1 Tax=Adlercreutzia sp. ZJ473 TaxID=2722822 RepID=UPI001551E904|nr:molybdopterin-dependent oxidoreductase [Adlercreutzia sp. ZJ473]